MCSLAAAAARRKAAAGGELLQPPFCGRLPLPPVEGWGTEERA